MNAPLRIVTHHLSLSDSVEALIRNRAEHLNRLFGGIVDCQVVVEGPERPRDGGGLYRVRIDLGLPGQDLVIGRQQGQRLEVAVLEAFEAAERRLESHARGLRRGAQEPPSPGERRRDP